MNGVSMIDGFVAYPERHGGAARLSVFFALWTLALVALNDVRVNAAPVYDVRAAHSGPGWWIAPADAPKVVTERMWDGLAQRSDVISGRWNVASAAPVAKHPKRHVVTAPTIASERAEAPKAVPRALAGDPCRG